jgi:hypothetical protein
MACETCGVTFSVKPSKAAKGEVRFCSLACRYGSLESRFWSKVNKDGPTPAHAPELGPCWEWTGAIAQGYGQIGAGPQGGLLKAHRVSWELHHGSVPSKLRVLHRCDNRRCVNPAHLFLGTQADNVADMDAKGRRRNAPLRGDAHPARHRSDYLARGERAGAAKLTEAQVIEIRRRAKDEGATGAKLAAEYGVSAWTIYPILRGKTWKHLL